jgi:hypothetical protein
LLCLDFDPFSGTHSSRVYSKQIFDLIVARAKVYGTIGNRLSKNLSHMGRYQVRHSRGGAGEAIRVSKGSFRNALEVQIVEDNANAKELMGERLTWIEFNANRVARLRLKRAQRRWTFRCSQPKLADLLTHRQHLVA